MVNDNAKLEDAFESFDPMSGTFMISYDSDLRLSGEFFKVYEITVHGMIGLETKKEAYSSFKLKILSPC